jgi:hypothetical protein
MSADNNVRQELAYALECVVDARDCLDKLYSAIPAGDGDPELYAELCQWLHMARMSIEDTDDKYTKELRASGNWDVTRTDTGEIVQRVRNGKGIGAPKKAGKAVHQ